VPGLRGEHRFARRAAAGAPVKGRHGPGLPGGRWALSSAPRDQAFLQLSRPGRHVQAVAAVLYGVGARLDDEPALLFALRGVEENDLIARAGEGVALGKAVLPSPKVLAEGDVAALFGWRWFEMASDTAPSERPRSGKRSRDANANADGRSGA
jgi:hypothetical protein